jgi:hypothetical protein
MVDGDARIELTELHQILEKTLSTSECLSEVYYTVLSLEHLLVVYGMFSLNTLLQSTTSPHVLVMWCDTNQLL